MEFASGTDMGKIRDLNEDSVFVPGKYAPRCQSFFMAVADGMGGHNAGEVASLMAIKSILSLLKMPGMFELSKEKPLLLLSRAITEANDKIWLLSRSSSAFSGMGTTITAALVTQSAFYIGHIGDSRAYIITEGGSRQITKDHTLVQGMVDSGELTPEQAKSSLQKHILTRALGVRKGESPALYNGSWRRGDFLLICSDGLTEHLDAGEFRDIITQAGDAEDACAALVSLALERGGTDNVTVALVKNTEGAA